MITIAELKSGGERRATVSVDLRLVAFGAVIMLLIAFGAMWKVMHDMRRLSASHLALEIETANYRAAFEALVRQIASQQPTNPEIVAASEASPASARLEPAVRSAVVRDSPAPTALLSPLTASEWWRPRPAILPVSPGAVNKEHGPDTEASGAGELREAEIEARAETAASERLRLAEAEPPLRTVLAQEEEATLQAVEETILEVVSQYVRGLESRSLPTLKRVWPTLGGSQERAIQAEFENARTVRTLFTDPRITIDGDTTTVTGVRIYSLVTQDGQRLSSMTRTTMTLRRIGNAWVIDHIVHRQ